MNEDRPCFGTQPLPASFPSDPHPSLERTGNLPPRPVLDLISSLDARRSLALGPPRSASSIAGVELAMRTPPSLPTDRACGVEWRTWEGPMAPVISVPLRYGEDLDLVRRASNVVHIKGSTLCSLLPVRFTFQKDRRASLHADCRLQTAECRTHHAQACGTRGANGQSVDQGLSTSHPVVESLPMVLNIRTRSQCHSMWPLSFPQGTRLIPPCTNRTT